MKKLTALILTGATAFAGVAGLTGCGESADMAREYMLNPVYEDNDRYTLEEVSAESISASADSSIYYYYEDSEGQVDNTLIGRKNTGGLSLEDYVFARAVKYGGNVSFDKIYGIDRALETHLSERNGEVFIDKIFTMMDGDDILSKVFSFHTDEVRYGNSDTYLYIPNVLEDMTDETTSVYPGHTGEFISTDEYMQNMFFYSNVIEDMEYETEKKEWARDGLTYITEEQFDYWFDDGELTYSELEEYFGAIFGKTVTAHWLKDNNGYEFCVYESVREADGVIVKESNISWIEDGKVNEICIMGPEDKWSNTTGAILMGVHKNN